MALISEGGNSNGQGFYSTYYTVSGTVPNQPKTAAKQATPDIYYAGNPTLTVPGFQPTTTELIIVGGLAAVAVFYFATHRKGK